jgi:hypothetical protein
MEHGGRRFDNEESDFGFSPDTVWDFHPLILPLYSASLHGFDFQFPSTRLRGRRMYAERKTAEENLIRREFVRGRRCDGGKVEAVPSPRHLNRHAKKYNKHFFVFFFLFMFFELPLICDMSRKI